MRILLTGASGFIGKHLLHALLAEGHEVVCAVRKPRPSSHPRLAYLHADFTKDTDKSAWLARLSQVDAVINAVGIFRETGAQTFDRLHVQTPRALFAACAESHDVHMVIQLSALGADEAADTPYHLSKKAADDYLATLPIRAAIIQPSLVYGPDGTSARVFKAMASSKRRRASSLRPSRAAKRASGREMAPLHSTAGPSTALRPANGARCIETRSPRRWSSRMAHASASQTRI